MNGEEPDLNHIKFINSYGEELTRELREFKKHPVAWMSAIILSGIRSLLYITIVWLIFVMGYFYSISGNSIENFGTLNHIDIEVRPPISGIDLYSKINQVMSSTHCGRGEILLAGSNCVSSLFQAQNKVLYTLALFVAIFYLGIIPLLDKIIKKLVSDTK